jgi:NAD(P)-dependent dehydrogenase (short-subunit alcohol dehydrogenase family)
MRTERTVIVTGGISGIGRAIAEAFARDGCRVWATARSAEDAREANPLPEGVAAWALDVTKPLSVADFLDGFYGQRLDVLVNAAGIILRDGHEFDPFNFARVVDVNLTGTMRMCVAAKDLLAESRGCIINIASMLSFFGSGHVPAYSASKGGVAQLTKSLAIAWAPQGIRVNAIAPGWIETAMTAPLVADPSRRDAIVARTPLARWGQPEDIAGAALFLASDAAAFITGVVLPVDGGYSIA